MKGFFKDVRVKGRQEGRQESLWTSECLRLTSVVPVYTATLNMVYEELSGQLSVYKLVVVLRCCCPLLLLQC